MLIVAKVALNVLALPKININFNKNMMHPKSLAEVFDYEAMDFPTEDATPTAAIAPSFFEEEEEKKEVVPAATAPQQMMIDTTEDDGTVIKMCTKIHECGHCCNGVANETECLPCLQPDC